MTNTLEKIMHNGDEYMLPRQKALVITLTSAGWSNNEQTVTATGVTATNTVIASPVPASISDYADAGIYCSAQGTDSLTFTCDSTPASDIEVNVLVLSAEAGSGPTPPSPWQPGANTLVYYNINDNDTNSTIYDLSGNNVDQTWSGTASYTTDATYGRVAVFDGSSQTEASSRVDFGGELTLIALFKLNSTSNNRAIFCECASTSRYPVGINIDGGYPAVYFASDNSEQKIQSTTALSTGQWYMIAMSRASDGTTKLYINGSIDSTGTASATPTYGSGANLRLSSWRGSYYQIDGQIKLCIGENRTWTDQEIADLASEYGFTVS